MDGRLTGWFDARASKPTNLCYTFLLPRLAAIAFAECNRAGNGMRKVTSAFPRMGWMEGRARARQWAGLQSRPPQQRSARTLDPPVRPFGRPISLPFVSKSCIFTTRECTLTQAEQKVGCIASASIEREINPRHVCMEV